jgi:hypothetical protein
MALYSQYIAHERVMLDATEAADLAEYAARDQFPKPPPSLIWRYDDGTPHYNNAGEPMVMASTLFNPEDLPENVRADLLVYEKSCDLIRDRHNTASLRQVADDHEAESSRLWESIASTPARSILGVAIKIGLGVSAHPDCETVMEFAARADALRLAGLPHTFGTNEPRAGTDESAESD